MKIEGSTEQLPKFGDLESGDCFMYDGIVYMKIASFTTLTGNMNQCTRTINAVRLRDGHACQIERPTLVKHLPDATVKY